MKKVADIYVRVSTSKQAQGDGLRRQEEVCRQWCKDNNIEVRNVIVDICSAFRGENLNASRSRKKGNLGRAIDSWRKKYWEDKGEPLTTEECSADVVGETPPDYLVVEDHDRFSRQEPVVAFTMVLFLRDMNTDLVSVNFVKSDSTSWGSGGVLIVK